MRAILGILVLCFGVGILGWWGANNNAVTMETEVTERAQRMVTESEHPLDVSVGGRDITVSGIASNDADRDAIVASLNSVDGRRVVIDDIQVLQSVSPYTFNSDLSADGQSYSGNVPTEAQRTAFSDRIGAGASGLSLAAGMPDAEWPGVVGQGLDSLSLLKNGNLAISDRDVAISGLAAFPQDRDAALAVLAGLPDGYTLTDDITLEDDGTPMRLTVRKDENGATAVGKVPSLMEVTSVSDDLGMDVNADGVAQANIVGVDANWPDFAGTGARALANLNSGTLAINDQELSLTGAATRDGKAEAEAKLASLANQYVVSSDISLADDGRPFALNVATGGDVTPIGKLPFDMDPSLVNAILGVDAPKSGLKLAEIESTGGAWPAAAGTSLQALASLNAGELDIQGQTIRLTGVATRAGRDAALETMKGVSSDFAQEVDISLSDDGAPFTLYVDRLASGQVASGKLPFGGEPTIVSDVTGVETDSAAITTAEIDDPNGAWSAGASTGLVALAALETGKLSVIDRTILVEGTATRAGRAAALSALDAAPDGFEISSDITIFDDGGPFGLRVDSDGTAAVASGKLPFDMPASMIGDILGRDVDVSALSQAEVGGDADLPASVAAGLNGLNALNTGTLDVSSGIVSLSGTATRAGRNAALAALTDVDDGVSVTTDIQIADDGVPFNLNVQKDESTANANGKLPFGMSTDVAALTLDRPVDVSGVALAEVESTRDFAKTAQTGLVGLAELTSGQLDVTETSIRLSGVATTPAVGDAVDAILADLGDEVTKTVDLTYLDDGSDPSWTVGYAAGEASAVSGKLPAGFAASEVENLAGIAGVSSSAVTGLTGDADPARNALASLNPYVSRLDGFTVIGEGDDISILAIAGPDENPDSLRAAMESGINVPLTVVASPNAVAFGTMRTLANGSQEEFTVDGWVLLPEPAPEPVVVAEVEPQPAPAPEPVDPFAFVPSIDACDTRSREILAAAQINFVTGGSNVDETSAGTIDELARDALNCLQDPNLTLEISGHTDSRGSADFNQRLSDARAQSVLAEMVARGVASDRVTAVGYGEDRPIADNETEEGLAANRRTEFKWSFSTTDNN